MGARNHEKPQWLTCCCCGNATKGRQWWNRDTGYGLCPTCADEIAAKEGEESVRNLAGERGYHFAIPIAK